MCDLPRRLQSWFSTIQSVVLTTDVFQFLIDLCTCMCNVRRFYWLRELYEANFHKPEIYGIVKVLANAWDVFSSTPFRGGRALRAACEFRDVFGMRRGFFRFLLFFSSNAHDLLQVWGRRPASFTSLTSSTDGINTDPSVLPVLQV